MITREQAQKYLDGEIGLASLHRSSLAETVIELYGRINELEELLEDARRVTRATFPPDKKRDETDFK